MPETLLLTPEALAHLPSIVFPERLDTLLLQLWGASLGMTRSRVQTLIKQGCVRLNDTVVTKTGTMVKPQDTLSVMVPPATPLTLRPSSLPVPPILFEDDAMLVVYKPKGMLTHPVGHQVEDTLVNVLLAHCGDSLSGIHGVLRPGIVHRLDRDTAGLLMVAKTDEAHQALSLQLQEKSAGRTYWAIVQGDVFAKQGVRSGDIETWLTRAGHAQYPSKRKVAPEGVGKWAFTSWHLEDTYHQAHYPGCYSLVACHLKTGRTHQIRVHMAHLGHPLWGDPFYGTGIHQQFYSLPSFPLRPEEGYGQALWAKELSFNHPVSQTRMTFQSPSCPSFDQLHQFLSR
ncbi:MAG: RluA family pseudouridine synthase [Vampirovibrionales bacterium]